MKKASKPSNHHEQLSRRRFLEAGGAAVIGGAIAFQGPQEAQIKNEEEQDQPRIRQYRTLGRTGFKASDISMGNTRNRDSAVLRYAYDHGINLFDTAERYVNGEAEKLLGEALKHMDRKKIFITTKIHIDENDTEETVRDRFKKCMDRMKTDYIDAFFMHSVNDLSILDHSGFHSATKRLKTEGRLKHIGVSCHGPRGRGGDSASMEDVLCATAEDGRFDLLLTVYNFMNSEPGEKVIAASKKNDVGVLTMKTAPGVLKVTPVDPENLTPEQIAMVERYKGFGMSEERAIERLKSNVPRQEEALIKTTPFAEKYGIKTDEQLHEASIKWVLKNPDVHSVCVSFADFDLVDRMVPISGKKLSKADGDFIERYKLAFNDRYCRHACNLCADKCPKQLPVSAIMRYAYYFECQGREKFAMGAYAGLKDRDASNCAACDAPCAGACPHRLDIRSQLIQAHGLLTLV